MSGEPELDCPVCRLNWTPARCDELIKLENGKTVWQPGPYIRCVECKSTFYRPIEEKNVGR